MLKTQLTQCKGTLFCIIVGLVFTAFIGCSSDEPTGTEPPQVSEIRIFPENATLEVDEQIDFSVAALSATGDTIHIDEIDIEWQWWSSDSDVFTVEAGGLATGQNPGEAYCVVEATVSFSQGETPDSDVILIYAAFGSGLINQKMTLETEVAEIYKSENIAMKKRLRFTGRDSAFVMVF